SLKRYPRVIGDRAAPNSNHFPDGTLVQRGNVHNWVNRGPEKCILAAVLLDADPVTVNGQPLPAHG
ncbi:MAG: hypothetical protein K2Z80_31250, partial [Xanthobacteraceae bacterium]|nr:hypothetical protein [Xanthobacteraceae bacterium]